MLFSPKSISTLPYGAYELKVIYQYNMLSATIITALGVGVIWFGLWIYKTVTYVDTSLIAVTTIESVMDLGPPPSIVQKPPQIEITQPKMAQPKVGIPKPVADDEMIDEEVVLATKEELAQINVSDLDFGNEDGIVVDIKELIPSSTAFIKVEVQPKAVHKTKPDYPSLAKQAGLEGTVYIRVLLDEDGGVMDAIVFKESGANAGFEDAALNSAREWKFTPAIQNGRPIKIWVTIPFEFKLNR